MSKCPLLLRICKHLKPIFPSEAMYLRARFRLEMGYPLNLKNPKTFSEKIQWLKLYNRRPEYTMMVDKYAVKDYVAQKIGTEYVVPTLGVWDAPEKIEWNKLPDCFVLKTTHGGGGGGVVICRDKAKLDKQKVIEKLKASLMQDISYYSCEWPYKNVPRKILAEKYLGVQSEINELRDYKFFCFNGMVQFLKVDIGRFKDHHANYYDKEFNLLPFGEVFYMPDRKEIIEKPKGLKTMISLAERLSDGIPFLRVDLYNLDGRIFFGETTFFPASGFENFEPMEWDKIIGDMLELPNKKMI